MYQLENKTNIKYFPFVYCHFFNRRSEPGKSILDPLNQMRKYVAETKKFQGQAEQCIPLSTLPTLVLQGTNERLLPMVTATIEKHRKRKHKHKSEKGKKKSKKGKAKKHKHKKHGNQSEDAEQDAEDASKSSSDSQDEKTIMKRKKLEMMRQQRLKREREEHARASKLIAQLKGDRDGKKHTESTVRENTRYNSQFHPELARQH